MGWLRIGLDWVLVARLLGFGCSVLFALAWFCLGFASAVAISEISCSARFALARFALFGLLGSVSVCAVAPHVCCRYLRDLSIGLVLSRFGLLWFCSGSVLSRGFRLLGF